MSDEKLAEMVAKAIGHESKNMQLQMLALMEQDFRGRGDLEVLRAVRAYRKAYYPDSF